MTMPAAPPVPVVLGPEDIAALPLEPIDASIAGVRHRVLWRSEASLAGVMVVSAGHRLGQHAHRVNHHHIWVLDGAAEVLGTAVGPGTYVHVPSGVEHDVDARSTEGCTLFYLYLRPTAEG